MSLTQNSRQPSQEDPRNISESNFLTLKVLESMSLSVEAIAKMRASFVADPMARVAQNALANNHITKIIPDAEIANAVKHTMGKKHA